ncbi:MAG: peptidase S41, partial [Acidobacteria bacterium]
MLFRSMRYGWDLSDTRLYLAPIEGGLPTPLAMPVSGGGDLSPDGTRVAYSPLARDFRTWKRHEGGWAQDLYIFDLDSYELEQVTDHVRSDRDPMWIGGKIYFSSDRDGTLNLYSYDTRTKVLEQLTTSDVWDVRWPSDDGDHQIAYELNGELQIYDIGGGVSRPLSIEVPDDGLAKRPRRTEVADFIEGFALSPKGERALFVARGDVFSAPIEKGRTRNLTQTSGAHDKWARWSPDGKQIAFISDATGEEEIYLVPQDGTGDPVQLTEGGQVMRYTPEWSPDGSRLAFSDKNGRVYVLEVESRELVQIADEARGQIRDYTWSPNGGYVAFSMSDINDYSSIYIWSVADRQLQRVTSEMFHDFEPVWDPDGDYLYYFSDREYAPQISSIEWNFATDRETYIYALALRDDVAHPLPPESDEVTIDEEKDDGDKGENGDKEEENGEEKSKDPIGIDFDGLAGRVARVPVDADNFGGLTAASGYLLYVKGTPFYYGRSADTKSSLQIFSFEDRDASTLAEDIAGYALSSDGKKVLVRHGSKFKLYDVKRNGKDSAKDVSTAGLVVDLVPEEEWAQIFDEVWRRNRDFFYVENMHGYDWEALREQYRPWLEHVGHRSDLNYLVGEMIAELNVGHTYKAGGDYE